MTDKFDIFGLGDSLSHQNRYSRLGFPRNPFKLVNDDSGPIFLDHIRAEVQTISRWLRDIEGETCKTPLTIQGSIGAGKSRLLRHLEQAIKRWPITDNARVILTALTSQGHGRASIGGLLLAGIESLEFPGRGPDGAIPLLRAIVDSAVPIAPSDSFRRVLRQVQSAKKADKHELIVDVSSWLRRQSLTPKRMRATGLTRTLDWEGQLLPILTTTLSTAHEVGVLGHCYVFIDQVEDLFRATFTALRRSRLLTDLRALVDLIDGGAPIGLIVAVTPEDYDSLGKKYGALASRLKRLEVSLPLLRQEHTVPFAETWIAACRDEPQWRPELQPKADQLGADAWSWLQSEKLVLPGDTVTPRNLLTALYEQVERLAKV